MKIAHAWDIIDSNGTSGLAPEQQVCTIRTEDSTSGTVGESQPGHLRIMVS
jgi:hypothetical protein